MTPKEKAEELVLKYEKSRWIDHDLAVKCALIAVDEIMKENLELPDEPETIVRYLYWQKVKNAINNL